MTALAAEKVGWCPGVLRPMETGDGFVVRIKPSGGVLPLAAAAAVADLAIAYGNGGLELTARSNLQIRGARPETLEPLTRGLASLGLLDADPETEAIRNVVASPLAGLDGTAQLDIRPVVAALERRLGSDAALRQLPAKWSFVIDDGGALNLAGIAADVRFEAQTAGRFLIGLGDDPGRASCAGRDLPDAAVALCRLALGPTPLRMAALLQHRAARDLFAAAGLTPDSLATLRPPTDARSAVGCHAFGTVVHVGIAAVFGGLHARDLSILVELARSAGACNIRLTPWRAVIVTGMTTRAASDLREALAGTTWISEPDDPRLRIAACPGTPGCHRGTTPVRADAGALAPLAKSFPHQNGIALHVSGCAKGCAHGQAAPWTLVGRDGLYDVVRDGKAGDPPLLRGLSFQQAAGWLSRSAGEGRR